MCVCVCVCVCVCARTHVFANAQRSCTAVSHTDGDTFIVTGDIDAMWLRDSMNQVLPYMRFINTDLPLRNLIRGLIARQARSVL